MAKNCFCLTRKVLGEIPLWPQSPDPDFRYVCKVGLLKKRVRVASEGNLGAFLVKIGKGSAGKPTGIHHTEKTWKGQLFGLFKLLGEMPCVGSLLCSALQRTGSGRIHVS